MPKLGLADFMDSLSVTSATGDTFRDLAASGHDTVPKLRALSVSDLAEFRRNGGARIGQSKAERIHASIHSPRVSELLDRADAWLDDAPAAGAVIPVVMDLRGKFVTMTGGGPASREILQDSLRAVGAQVKSAASKDTDFFIAPALDNKKAVKAAERYGTRVVTYAEIFGAT